MTTEERYIIEYLKASPRSFFSSREIARRAAGKGYYQENPRWPKPLLPRLAEKGEVEVDSAGHFRIKQAEVVKLGKRRWVSPQVARLLKRSGADFSGQVTIELEEMADADAPIPAKQKAQET